MKKPSFKEYKLPFRVRHYEEDSDVEDSGDSILVLKCTHVEADMIVYALNKAYPVKKGKKP